MSLTEQETRQALQYAVNGAMFMYRATDKMSMEILGGSPVVKGMVPFVQQMLMTRQWINLDSNTVIEYCKKTLDSRNTYVLDNSDIKVIPEPVNINIK